MIQAKIKDIELKFYTNEKVFSPTEVDKGTIAMLEALELTAEDKVLDLGCGYGVVGIYVAKVIGIDKVVLSDSSENSVKLSKDNAKLNGVEGVKIVQSNAFKSLDEAYFTYILTYPPYHVDFNVPKEFIEKGFNRLKIGGKMVMVTKRKEWYKNRLTAIFGGVQVKELEGYFIFTAEKRFPTYANKKGDNR
ncbi:MAG: methyltransferase [Fusobacteria bacterium]|nr:methyltransferase [Fusobacteriota bacterium]